MDRLECRRRFAIGAAITIGLTFSSCGGGKPPVGPTPPTTLAPTPAPPPVSNSCPLGAGHVDVSCDSGPSRLLPNIEVAIDLLVREKPQLLDLEAESPENSGQYKVLDAESYLNTIVENLRRQLLCAERDGDDLGSKKILAKDGNADSETFDVLSASGFIRRGSRAYVTTCTPAAFPIERTASMPPAGSGCGRPYPPAISRFDCKVHLRAPEYYTVDSTPKIGPNKEYCAEVGFSDGRLICPVRAEGWPDREACENWLVGRAKDTGRFGPTWTNEKGQLCTGRETNCMNHPDNQYQVLVYDTGWMRATAENGAEGSCLVER